MYTFCSRSATAAARLSDVHQSAAGQPKRGRLKRRPRV